MSAEPLRELITKLETTTADLNNAIDAEVALNNQLQVAKAQVKKNQNIKDLLKEQIMSEKALIKATH